MGAAVVGASTVPEQTAAYLMGLKGVSFSAVTNPGTGLIENFVHD